MSTCRFQIFGAALAVALSILPPLGYGRTLRVATWNLQPTAAIDAPKEISIPEAAAVLRKLNPDVVLLQHVRDWRLCTQLAEALKPAEYSVAVCSAFHDAPTGGLGRQQVAILARQRPYFSWSEAWRSRGGAPVRGGFAFAAIKIESQRVGFWSVDASEEGASVAQLMEQVGSVRDWVTNQAGALVIAGAFGASRAGSPPGQANLRRLLDDAGFAEASAERIAGDQRGPSQKPTRADCIFTQPPDAAANAAISPVTVSAHYPVSCDLELDSARITPIRFAPREPAPAAQAPLTNRSARTPLEPQPPAGSPGPQAVAASKAETSSPWLGLMAVTLLGGSLMVVVLGWSLAKRRRRRFAGPMPIAGAGGPASLYTLVVATQSATGSAPGPGDDSTLPPPAVQLAASNPTHTHAAVLRGAARAQRSHDAAAALRTGLIAQVSGWLKQKLVRRLIADRAHLLAAQEEATLQAGAVERRLARVEQQIQQQNRAYQARIDELSRQLLAAKEENRDLIRAQIVRVKIDMEAARARLMAQAKGEQ